MRETATMQTEKLTNELAEVREKQRDLEIRKLNKLLDRSLEETSKKETRHDSLPKKSSDTSRSPKKKKKKKRKQKNDKN